MSVRYMIMRPSDNKLGYILYKTEKEAIHRGLMEKDSKYVVVKVETEVKADVASADEVTVINIPLDAPGASTKRSKKKTKGEV